MNAKRIYRLYAKEGLIVRTRRRKERARRNEKWSMDFVAQRPADNRWIRVLTVVDQYTRECLTLHADTALSGEEVSLALDRIVSVRGAPKSITVDSATAFASKAMDHWAYTNGVHLDFIRPRSPVENGYIVSFKGKLRDECLNVEVFFTLADARRKLDLWQHYYNHDRPRGICDPGRGAACDANRRRSGEAACRKSGANGGGSSRVDVPWRLRRFTR